LLTNTKASAGGSDLPRQVGSRGRERSHCDRSRGLQDTRIKTLINESDGRQEALAAELDQVDSDFNVFRIQLFNEFKKYVFINSLVAVLLIVGLIVISYMADEPLPITVSLIFVAASVLPAPITLGTLWFDASAQLRPLKTTADGALRSKVGI
jgi:hypothetical protein